jgi:hypothetical protein
MLVFGKSVSPSDCCELTAVASTSVAGIVDEVEEVVGGESKSLWGDGVGFEVPESLSGRGTLMAVALAWAGTCATGLGVTVITPAATPVVTTVTPATANRTEMPRLATR